MKIGKFKVESGRIIVCDPCYTPKMEAKYSAVNGEWQASVSGTDRNASLTASTKGSSKYPWVKDTKAGVDSGQMSVFDLKFFRDDAEAGKTAMPKWMTPKRIKSEGPGEVFYGACCTMTSNEQSAGSLPHGAISASGYGDGLYPIYIKKNPQGKVVAVSIKF